jgi:hypothetical protein
MYVVTELNEGNSVELGSTGAKCGAKFSDVNSGTRQQRQYKLNLEMYSEAIRRSDVISLVAREAKSNPRSLGSCLIATTVPSRN